MKHAVFFRNLNLGRARCPTKSQFETAFTVSGARNASSFLTNGTLVFEAASAARAQKILADACTVMATNCGLVEPAFLRTLDYLSAFVASEPFAHIEPESVYERCITFLEPKTEGLPELPLTSKRGDVHVFRFTGSEALSINYEVGKSPGSPNAFLEKLLDTKATTRSWSTVHRLVRRYA